VSVGELYIQGIERLSGEEPFSTGKAFGGPKSYDSTETVILYIIYVLYSLYRLGGPVEGKLFCALHKMMESGEIFLVQYVQRV
jgi:hypothetical protein